jgi:hypothetical protein
MMEYEVASSWSWLCMVPMTLHFDSWPLMFSKDSEKDLMEENGPKKLFWYDIKNKTHRIVENDLSNKFWTETCGGSLLLLDGDSDN